MADDRSFQIWVADALVKVLPDMPPATTDGGVIIDAVRNEYESGQFVVTAGKKTETLTVKVAPFTGPSDVRPKVEAHFVGFVPVRKGTVATPPEHLVGKPPVDVPDPLLEVESVTVEEGKNQPVWLTVFVPKSTRPGEHSTNIEVTMDGASVVVPLTVNVLDFTLPDDRNLYLTNWFYAGRIARAHDVEKWTEPFWKMLGVYAQFMAEYRQNVIMTPILELIVGQDDGDGNLTFDFSRFDKWVEVFQKAGVIGTIEGGHLAGRAKWKAVEFDVRWPEIRNADGSIRAKPSAAVRCDSEQAQAFLAQFLPALQKHLEEKGWLDIYLQHLADEPIKVNAESYKKLAATLRKYASKIRIIEACETSDLVGAIDIWVPKPPHFEKDIEFFRERRKAGDDVWFYTCLAPKEKYMNRFVDYHLLPVRLLHWVNFKYDLSGYLHWALNSWRDNPFTDLEPGEGENYLPPGDTHIAYPGKNGPLSSIRLEAMRDGVEDYEMLRLLAKKDPEKARAICDSAVRSLTEYTLDPCSFRVVRKELTEALAQLPVRIQER